MKRLLAVLIVFTSSLALGQGAFVPQQTAFKVVNGQTSPIAGATITVCAASTAGLPCSPALVGAIFKDAALTQPLTNPFTADALGNYQFAAAPGTYTVTVTALGFVGNSYQAVTSNGSAGTGTVSAVTSGGGLSLSAGGTSVGMGPCGANQTWLYSGTAWGCNSLINPTGTQLPSATPAGLPSFTNFCPSGMNPTSVFQRADASYASFQGVDETSAPGGLPAGTPSWCHRFFVNDTSLPIFMKNALVSIYHTYGNGNTTSTGSDDRALAIRTETSASISGGFPNSRLEGVYGETGIKGAPTSFGSGPDQGQEGIRWVIDDQHNSTLTTASKSITGTYTQSAATAVYSGCQVCAMGLLGQVNLTAAANNNQVFFAAVSSDLKNSGGATNSNGVNFEANYATSGNFANQWGLWVHGGFRVTDWAILNDTLAPVNLGPGLFTGAISTTGGSVPVSNSLTGASALTTSQIAAPAAPSVSTSGTPGGTSYSYVLCARDGAGGGVCGTAGSTNTGNATLNTSNFNSLSFTGVKNVSSYDIYRTVGGVTGKIANVLFIGASSGTGWTVNCALNRGANNTCTFNDQGATGDGTVPPPLNTTGGISIAGPVTSGKGLNNLDFYSVPYTTGTTVPSVDATLAFNNMVAAMCPAVGTGAGCKIRIPNNAHLYFNCNSGTWPVFACIPLFNYNSASVQCENGYGPIYVGLPGGRNNAGCTFEIAVKGAYLFEAGQWGTTQVAGPSLFNVVAVDVSASKQAAGELALADANNVHVIGGGAFGGFRSYAVAPPSAPTCAIVGAGGSIGSGLNVQVKIEAWTNSGPTLASAGTTCSGTNNPTSGTTNEINITMPAQAFPIIGYEGLCSTDGGTTWKACTPIPTFTTNADGSVTMVLPQGGVTTVTSIPAGARGLQTVNHSQSVVIPGYGSQGWLANQGFSNDVYIQDWQCYLCYTTAIAGLNAATMTLTNVETSACDITGTANGSCNGAPATPSPGQIIGTAGLRLYNVHETGFLSGIGQSSGCVITLTGFVNIVVGGTIQGNTGNTEIGLCLVSSTRADVDALQLANYATALQADAGSTKNEISFADNGSNTALIADSGTGNHWTRAGFPGGAFVPVVTGTGACSTVGAVVGGERGGRVPCTGTTGAATLTITPGITAQNGWSCYASDVTHTVVGSQSANSTTACTITLSAVTSNDVISYSVQQY